MTNRELVAKTVFGEITLGEVFKIYENNVSHISVEEGGVERGKYESFQVEEDQLQLYGEWEMEHAFWLGSKVKVQEDFLEIEDEGLTYHLTFVESKTIKFSSLLPGDT